MAEKETGQEWVAWLLIIVAVIIPGLIIATPFALALIGAYGLYRYVFESDAAQEKRARQKTIQLFEDVKATVEAIEIKWTLPEPLIPFAEEMLRNESVWGNVPQPPAICNSIPGARYRDNLAKLAVQSEKTVHEARDVIEKCLEPFVNLFRQPNAKNTVPAEFLLGDMAMTVDRMIRPILNSHALPELRRVIERNLRDTDCGPLEYKGDSLLWYFLCDTPLIDVFDVPVPFEITEEYRTQHHFILGGTGHGKTQCMSHYILEDITKVKEGKASVIVIDSQGDLIDGLRRLEGLNEDNTVIIDPEDVAFPVCLNLFDVKQDRLDSYSQLARERQYNGIIELYDYVLGSLLAADLTQKQSVVFRYVTRLLLTVPNATIHTMLELFQDGGLDKYLEYVDKLDPTARSFFLNEFAGKEFAQTRKQVVRRLYGILENQAFNRMFTNPQSKLDLFEEMNSGKLILINTAKSLLKEEGTEIFGRFFIAMITQAAQEREELSRSKRLPCFVYIDEANDYRFDDKIDLILTQARKYRVGLCLATQYLDKISPKLQAAIAANTAIKFAGGASNRDARRMAPDMRCEYQFIEDQPPLTFAVHVRGLTRRAVPLKFTPGEIDRHPKASTEAEAELREKMRARYAEPMTEFVPPQPPPVPEPPSDTRKGPPPDEDESAANW